jgi:hypothetical protein
LPVRSLLRQFARSALCLLPALSLTACGTASLPKLTDLMESNNPPVAAPTPQAAPSPGLQAPPPSATAAVPPPERPFGTGVDAPLPRAPRGQDVIVGFKGPTVILFGGEFGNEGERVSASAINVPLQVRNAASNTSRVQIDTAQGPRWVARSEITLGALEPRPTTPR